MGIPAPSRRGTGGLQRQNLKEVYPTYRFLPRGAHPRGPQLHFISDGCASPIEGVRRIEKLVSVTLRSRCLVLGAPSLNPSFYLPVLLTKWYPVSLSFPELVTLGYFQHNTALTFGLLRFFFKKKKKASRNKFQNYCLKLPVSLLPTCLVPSSDCLQCLGTSTLDSLSALAAVDVGASWLSPLL